MTRKKRETHGHAGRSPSPTYRSWMSIIQRCCNPANPWYPRYGGAGINLHEPWRQSFALFYEEVGDRPEGTSMDRVDNSLGYVPGNVRWATPLVQSHNSSRIKLNEGVVRDIRRRSRAGEPTRAIARDLKIDRNNVRSVIRRLTWAHVADDATCPEAPNG